MKYFMKLVLITWLSLAVKADDESPPEELDLEADMQDIVPFVGNGSVSPQMPFMVSVRRTTHELTDRQFGNGHICGGVVISRNHILTAASCIQIRANRIPTSEIFVIAGTRYRYVNDKNVRSAARNISIHPNYSFDPLMNNLAIIELNTTLPDDDETISPIDFSNTIISVGSNCQIFGWGLPLSMHGPRELLAGNINIVSYNICGNRPNQICAGPDFISGCAGDDGGPVVCNDRLFGLIDFTDIHYCNNSLPGRHTSYISIANYHDWITLHLVTQENDGDQNGGAAQILIGGVMFIAATVVLKFFN